MVIKQISITHHVLFHAAGIRGGEIRIFHASEIERQGDRDPREWRMHGIELIFALSQEFQTGGDVTWLIESLRGH